MDLAPVQIGCLYLCVVQIERIDAENIAIEHDEIPAFTRLDAAGSALLLQRESGIDGIGVDHVLQGEALLGQQRRPASLLASRYGMFHGDERIETAHPPIAAAGDFGAGIAQRARRIKMARALRTDVFDGRAVGIVVELRPQQLKIRDHAEFLEAGKIRRIYQLQMGDLSAIVERPARMIAAGNANCRIPPFTIRPSRLALTAIA